ncbi:hypothetical protein Tco_1258256 [Tanacetum coccineum]
MTIIVPVTPTCSSSKNKTELDDVACEKMVLGNAAFSEDMCSLGDAASSEMAFLDDVPALDMMVDVASLEMVFFADVPSANMILGFGSGDVASPEMLFIADGLHITMIGMHLTMNETPKPSDIPWHLLALI